MNKAKREGKKGLSCCAKRNRAVCAVKTAQGGILVYQSNSATKISLCFFDDVATSDATDLSTRDLYANTVRTCAHSVS